MRVPLKWLNEFVEADVEVAELARKLTLAGLEVEKIDIVGAEWDKVFTASVIGVERHPDADRLVLADVEAGEHRLTVVTGAPNIAAGQKVVLALAGARLIDGHSDSGEYKTLKPGKIRGVMSEGMVCSEKELGMSDEHEGILVLSDDTPPDSPCRSIGATRCSSSRSRRTWRMIFRCSELLGKSARSFTSGLRNRHASSCLRFRLPAKH